MSDRDPNDELTSQLVQYGKWWAGVAGGIGAVLTGGLSLAPVADLRTWAAVSVVVAVVGVVLLALLNLASVGSLLVNPRGWDDLTDDEQSRADELGYSKADIERWRTSPANSEKLIEAERSVIALVRRADAEVAFDRFRSRIQLSALVVAAFVVLYAIASTFGSETPPSAVEAPIRVEILLREVDGDDGEGAHDALASLLGSPNCDFALPIGGFLVAGDFTQPVVVVDASGTCNPGLVELPESLLVALPLLP